MSLERNDERKAFSIETTFTGAIDEVLGAIKAEMVAYDPRGYGTSVDKILWTPGGNGELRVTARMHRSKSCD